MYIPYLVPMVSHIPCPNLPQPQPPHRAKYKLQVLLKYDNYKGSIGIFTYLVTFVTLLYF